MEMNIDFRKFSPNNDYRYSNMIVRTIKILRNESGYGFTLSRYVVQDEQANQFYQPKGYPVSSSSNNSFQQLNTSINLNEKNSGSYEIVFVKHVKIGGSAYIAGLREGDRPICINNIPLSDKSYSDIISIIEQSGLVLELKVIASSSSSLSSIPFLDQSQLKLNRIAEKPSTFQHYEQSTATRGGTSSPIRRQANFTSDYSTLGLTPNSNLVSAEPLTNRTHRNTIGLGSLGMSALFYSFLKNNARGTGSSADSGYESRIDNSGMANRTSSLYQETEKNSPNKSLPLAQLKLKNLQEVIAKSYSKEELSKYGIMVPNVQSPSVAQNKENLNRAQYNNYSNSGSIDNPIDSKFNQKYINYNPPPLSTKGEDLPTSMSRNPDYKYHPHGNQDDQKFKSPLTNPFYYEPKISYKFDTKHSHPFFQPDLTSLQNNRQSLVTREQSPSVGQHHFFAPNSPSNLNSTSPPTALSPTSNLSSNSVLSSSSMASSNSSNSTVSQTQTNTTSTLNYFQDCDSSMAGSSLNLNKSAPNTFSKYIETVHRALYDEGHRYRPLSTASSDLTAQAEFPINKPKVITTNQETLGGQQVSKQFVENRRQIFERTNKMENKSFSDKSLNRKPSLKNQSNNFSFDETRDLERTPTPTSYVPKSDVAQSNRDKSLINENRNKEINPLGNRYLTNFNHVNRSSYRGECKRLMSRANLETVAERAAHFEDVDPERYEKLKSKFVDLDTAKQDEIHLLLLQHQHHQQQLLNNSLSKKTNSLSPVRLSKTNENEKNDSKWNYAHDTNQNYFFHNVNSRNPYVQAQLNPRKGSMFNRLDSSSVSTPMPNFHEATSSFNPLVDNMASPNHQFYNDSNNFKIQQLIAKRRSITSSPIRKNTTNIKTSHQIQSSEINSNETDFRKSKIFEGSNSSQLPRPSSNKSKNSNKSYTRSFALNSDAGETTSTDSDIGTSPSGITLASPPSSPQQPQQSPAKNYYTNFDQSNRSNYSPNINTPSLNYSSIIRQHSYLNAVQLNDFKINKLMQSNFAPINEHEAKDYDFLNPSSVPYYYSPSSTVMRQQKLLQIQHQHQQHQHHQHQQHEANQVATSTPTSERSKSTNRTAHGSSTEHGRTARVKSAQASSRAALQWSSNQESDGAKSKKNEPKQTRNTSIKKLKSFFGERTPVVLQAVESKNVIASDDYLAGQPNQTVKEGVLICKMVLKDGKRSPDRSWRPAWAVLKRSGELFLCKEKKDNVMVPSMDSAYPISVKNSLIDIAYDYTKRKNVFKIRSVNCEYLFQTIDHDSMLEWIRVMQESANDSLDKLVTCMSSSNKNWLVNTIESEHNSLDLSAHSPPVLHSRKSMHNSAEAVNWSPDDSYSRGRAATDTDVSPRRADNRKWVRQMTRRIKDFMGSASAEPMAHEQYATHGRNFGIALERCEPSTLGVFVPVVIEVCTRLVECHIVDEGLYRKVGQKQVVLALRSQLNAGVMSVDVSDHNWDNPHAVVSLLKCFLNELPDSLTTSHLYNEFINVCRSDQHHGRIVGVKRLLNKLPKHNYETLKYLTAHLRRVAAAYQHNKMTIKNLSIAFSQSIIRHNEANCETIRSDHLAQSLLIELILIYHDWLFDPSQTENIPMEIKDSAEQHLSQQYCSYIEPIAYSDLLINIIKLLRSRWNSTNSTMNTPSNTHHSNDSGYYSNLNANRQPINIQFKRDKPRLRSSKSVTAMNRGRAADPKLVKQVKGFSIKQSFREAKQRSRSVDTRFKPLSFILGLSSPSTSHTVDSYHLEASQTSLNRRKLFKKKKPPLDAKFLHHPLNTHQQGHKSTPLARKSYAAKAQPTSLKELERANQTNLDRLNQLMKKLEVDLINAQMEVIEDDYRKTHSAKCKHISSSVSSSSSTSGVVAGSSSSCVSASPMVRKTKPSRAQRVASLSSISSSYEDLSLGDAKKILRRHTVAGLVDQGEQECRADLLNFEARRKQKLALKSKKFSSKSIGHLACHSHSDRPDGQEKGRVNGQQVKQTMLNFSSPLSISASSVSSVSTSTSSLNKINGLGRVAVNNLADEVGSIGLAVSQLSSCVNESLL